MRRSEVPASLAAKAIRTFSRQAVLDFRSLLSWAPPLRRTSKVGTRARFDETERRLSSVLTPLSGPNRRPPGSRPGRVSLDKAPSRSATSQNSITLHRIRAAALFLRPPRFWTAGGAQPQMDDLKPAMRWRLGGQRGRLHVIGGAYAPSNLLFESNTRRQPFTETLKLKKLGEFCFTAATGRSKLGRADQFGCSCCSALGVVRIELISQNVDGDFGHEENRFVRRWQWCLVRPSRPQWRSRQGHLKAPPPAAFDPWDVAFGAAVMTDYGVPWCHAVHTGRRSRPTSSRATM